MPTPEEIRKAQAILGGLRFTTDPKTGLPRPTDIPAPRPTTVPKIESPRIDNAMRVRSAIQESQGVLERAQQARSTITSGDLTTISAPKITLPTPIQFPDISAIPITEPKQKALPAQETDFTKRIGELETLITRAGEKGIETQRRTGEATFEPERQIVEINKQLKMLQAEDLKLKEQAEKRNVLEPFAAGEEQRARRNLAIEAIRLSATSEALQGNIVLAERQARRAVETEFAETARDIQIKRQNIVDNYDLLTPVQKKRADALLLQLDRQDEFVKQQRAVREAIEKKAIEVAASGKATNKDIEQVRSAKDEIEATRLAEPFLRKEAREEFATGTIGEFQRIFGRTPTHE